MQMVDPTKSKKKPDQIKRKKICYGFGLVWNYNIVFVNKSYYM